MAPVPRDVSSLASRRRARFVALPAPLIDELLRLDGDRLKIVLRLLQRAAWEPSTVDGIRLDPGECLISYRSERVWGGIAFEREVSASGLRSFVRRTIAWLVDGGFVSTRPAHRSGPPTDPRSAGGHGPPPTVIRFLKFREILWPGAAAATYPGTGEPAHVPAHATGSIAPGALPVHREAAGPGTESSPTPTPSVVAPASGTVPARGDPGPADHPLVRRFLAALAPHFGAGRLRTTEDPAQWGAMETELQRVGVDAAVLACVERAARRRPGQNAIGSLWWFLPRLRELPNAAAAGSTNVEPTAETSCSEWAEALALLRDRVNADVLTRWIDPLDAVRTGDTLLLLAPDRYHRDFVADNYSALLQEALVGCSPAHASLRVAIRERGECADA